MATNWDQLLNPLACRSAFTALTSCSNSCRDINPSTWLNKLLERTIFLRPPSVVGLRLLRNQPKATSVGGPLIALFQKSYFGQVWAEPYPTGERRSRENR